MADIPKTTSDRNANGLEDINEPSRLSIAGADYREHLLAKNTPSPSDDNWKGYTKDKPYDTNNV